MQPAPRLDEVTLPDYLRRRGILDAGSPVRIEPAGDGNINWVRRVSSGERSWIVKQARPALERFPEYRASTERIVFEARYYARVRPLDREGVCPKILDFDPAARVLVIEDLGAAERLDRALASGRDIGTAPARLARFLGTVHAATGGPALAREFANDEMRRLHGDHIFHLPFHRNEFPLPPAVRARAEAIWRDLELARTAAAAYRRYLEPRGALVHGDVQAGNVLLAPGGAKLLDAEIVHVGDPAFDVGTLAAHLLLPAAARGAPATARAGLEALFSAYRDAGGPAGRTEALRYAGIEMLRRTIGAARVAVVEREAAALAVLDVAERLVRSPETALR
jgi:5-methylthioribose kinase